MLEADLYQNPTVKLKLKKNGIELDTKVVKFEYDRVFLELGSDFESYIGFFTEGREVEMTICSNARLVQLISLVIDTPDPKTIVMELHEDFSIIQRRKFVRTNAQYRITFYANESIFQSTTVNIGGGGLCFIANEQCNLGQEYDFQLMLPFSDEPVEGKGVIINKIEKDGGILAMFSFTKIQQDVRNKIVRFCFEREFNK